MDATIKIEQERGEDPAMYWKDLPVYYTEELLERNGETQEMMVASCPLLKLAAYGKDKDDALARLIDMIDALLNHLIDLNNYVRALQLWGWISEDDKLFRQDNIVRIAGVDMPPDVLISS